MDEEIKKTLARRIIHKLCKNTLTFLISRATEDFMIAASRTTMKIKPTTVTDVAIEAMTSLLDASTTWSLTCRTTLVAVKAHKHDRLNA
jgi:hypothetical protein